MFFGCCIFFKRISNHSTRYDILVQSLVAHGLHKHLGPPHHFPSRRQILSTHRLFPERGLRMMRLVICFLVFETLPLRASSITSNQAGEKDRNFRANGLWYVNRRFKTTPTAFKRQRVIAKFNAPSARHDLD